MAGTEKTPYAGAMSEPPSDSAIADALARARGYSPYLRRLIERHEDTVALLEQGRFAEARAVHIDPTLPAAMALRHAKGRLALALGLLDLAGLIALEDLTQALTGFADAALDHALAAAMAELAPDQPARGFVIIALGKQGSGELNYSSDLDPIFLFDPATLPRRGDEDPAETAARIGRRVIEIMQRIDADGYVFRMDMRLRPHPEVTPLALPVGAAIAYYESSAEGWERAAFIRARACAGDIALGESFLAAIQPFVWRRGLDFGVRDVINGIIGRIRDHYAEGQEFGPGFDLKRGQGGIRECEFFAQIHQLIHGGRDPALRIGATVPVLAALAGKGWISRADARALTEAYRLFRTIEHRLQMVSDQQTHSLPQDTKALDNVAHLHGAKSGAALLRSLAPHVATVARIFATLLPAAAERAPEGAALDGWLAAKGLKGSKHLRADVARRIGTWRSGRYRALRSGAAREALEAMLPQLVEAFATAPDPLRVANRFDQILEALPSALNLFTLLAAQPQLLALLVSVLAHSPRLADDLARRATLIDGLIDASALAPLPPLAALAARMACDGDASLEEQLDRVRHVTSELRFALGVQIVTAARDPVAVAGDYARLAEAAIDVVTEAVAADFVGVHGRVPGCELVILALGRFGGGEMTHASDLDLIFLFTGPYLGTSDGAKPLGTMHYFNRLTQRIIAGLSVPTAAGPLYEVDARLRPSGGDGELCVSLDGFADYQQRAAWNWEHIALTRARVIHASAPARAATEAVLTAVMRQPRDLGKLAADAREMRATIAKERPAQGWLDVKLAPGGMTDIEFAVSLATLQAGKVAVPQVVKAISRLGLAPALADAYALMTRVLLVCRLVAPDGAMPPPATRQLVAQACGCASWAVLQRRIEAAYVAGQQAFGAKSSRANTTIRNSN